MAAVGLPMTGSRWPSVVAGVAVGFLGCASALWLGGSALAQPLVDGPVIWYEDDRQDVPEPPERDPNLLWDMINDSVVLSTSRLTRPERLVGRVGTIFGGDHVPPAANLNSLDEVPNSAWFTNRIGLFAMSTEEVARGSGTGAGPDRSDRWTVISAKTEGVTPGFVIRDVKGDAYLIKFDPPGHLGMTSGAGVISGRILHAAGYNVPDDAVVSFRRDELELGKGVKLKLPDGSNRPMTREDLDALLDELDRLPDGSFRAISSKFLEGVAIGPFDYHGRRKNDPNDGIDHQNRRELRGLRIFAAWINHFDTKQHNSLDMYLREGGHRFVRHYLIDFASTLGSGANGPVPRYGYEYTFDPPATLGRLLALGFHEDPWRYSARPVALSEVGYFESEPFDPLEFKPLQPNSAFACMTDRDGYWAAKIISAFTDEQLAAIVEQACYRDPEASLHVTRTLSARRDKIARCFFDRVPPLDFFAYRDGTIECRDLGAERGTYAGTRPMYRARLSGVAADRSARGWSPWEIVDRCLFSPMDDYTAATSRETWPFVAVECQVDRGEGWGRSVRAYFSRRTGQTVAIER